MHFHSAPFLLRGRALTPPPCPLFITGQNCVANGTFGCINGFQFNHSLQYVCGVERTPGEPALYFLSARPAL